MTKITNQLEYISKQSDLRLLGILDKINQQQSIKKENILEIIKQKINFILKNR